MNPHRARIAVWAIAAFLLCDQTRRAGAAGQASLSFEVKADVFANAAPPLATGSPHFHSSLTVDQRSLTASPVSSPAFVLSPGFQAACGGLDSDGDGTPDADDDDDDGDGVPDSDDSRLYDTDGDGANNVGVDTDDDNDGLPDGDEWLFGTSRIVWDTDGDGPSDKAEWVAGTRGNDAGDYFRIASIAAENGAKLNVQWVGVEGRLYTVLAAGALDAAPVWTEVWSTNAVRTTEITCQTTAPETGGVFRLRVELPVAGP